MTIRTITITSGYVMAENEEAEQLLYKLIEDDALWEYISVLISKDIKETKKKQKQKDLSSEQRILYAESEQRLSAIEKMLHDIDSKLSANPVVQVQAPASTPAPATASEEVSAKPVQPKKVKKTNVSGKGGKGFLAAAQKASSFR